MTTKVNSKQRGDTPFATGSYPVPVVRIEQKTALLSALLDTADYGVTCIDASGEVVDMNKQAEDVFGVSEVHAVGLQLENLPQKARDALLAPYREVVQRGEETKSLTLCGAKPGKPGSFVQWSSRFVPVADAGGHVHFVVVISSPVSDTQELIDERDAFLALLGHTVRTPLTALTTYLSALERSGADSKIISRMHCATQTLAKQTNNMLLVADIVAGTVRFHRRALDVRVLLDELAQTHNTNDTRISVRGTRHVLVRADRKYLTRALCEVLENALAASREQDTVYVSVRLNSHNVRIRIKDMGRGIEQADVPHVFDRYHRVSGSELYGNEGMGLGLYLAKEIIARHDGTIRIDSGRGGTVVTLSLPLYMTDA